MPTDLTSAREAGLLVGRRHQHRPIIRPVSQVNCSLNGGDLDEIWTAALEEILRWLSNRASGTLPEEAWDGRSFELEHIGTQPTAAIRLSAGSNIDYWAARNEAADANTPNRGWVTEIGLARTDREMKFGIRLTCVTRGDNPPFAPSIPGLVRQLADNIGLRDQGRVILSSPIQVDDGTSAEELVDLLADKRRTRPVFAISRTDSGTIINPNYLAGQCCGAGHVAVISPEASFALTDLLGREYSVYRGAVRTYRPGFDPEEDQPSDHPVCRAERIRDWPDGGPVSFAGLLISEAIRATVTRPDFERDLPSFSTVRQVWLQTEQNKAHTEGNTESGELEIANQRIEELQSQMEDQKSTYDGLLNEADQEFKYIETERNEVSEQNRALRARVEHLQSALKSRPGLPVTLPDSFEDIDEWASTNLTGRVVLLNRAKRALQKAKFENVQLVDDSLLLLHDYYAPMRIEGGQSSRSQFEERCRDLGLSEEPCFTGPGAGEQGDAYFVLYKGRRRELDRHLKRGNSHEERYCLRVYFFWDDDDQQVIVGWLPSHLPTRLT